MKLFELTKIKDYYMKKYNLTPQQMKLLPISKDAINAGISYEKYNKIIKAMSLFKKENKIHLITNDIKHLMPKLFVKQNLLPRYLYRGMAINRQKLTYLKKQKIINFSNVSSWTTDINVAKFFTTYNMIDNLSYLIILKLDLQKYKEKVLFDFRLYEHFDFYDEQEILMASGKYQFEIFDIIDHNDDKEIDYRKSISYKDNIAELIFSDFFKIPNKKYHINKKIDFKILKDLSVNEIINKYNINYYNRYNFNLQKIPTLMPLFVFASSVVEADIKKFEKNKVLGYYFSSDVQPITIELVNNQWGNFIFNIYNATPEAKADFLNVINYEDYNNQIKVNFIT